MVNIFLLDEVFPDSVLVFLIPIPPQYHRGGMSSKSVHGREAKSLKNGIPTLCKGLQFNSSASPCRPPKQTNKQTKTWYLAAIEETKILD